MSSRRKRQVARPPWWDCWPKLRWYFGLESLVVLRYQAWGGVELLSWCPVFLVEYNSRPPLPPEMIGVINVKRPVVSPGGSGRHAAPPDEISVLYPLLGQHLTSLLYDEEPPAPRETSTLLLFGQDGSFRACLRDRQEKRCLWVASVSWNELLLVLESALEDPMAVWREDRMSGADSAKRIPNPRKGG